MCPPARVRNVNAMDNVFSWIRNLGFRRGPDGVLGGVCAGIARSLRVEPNLVRLVTVALMIFAGLPLAAYLIVWVLTPAQNGSIPAQTFLASLGVGTNGAAHQPTQPYPTNQASYSPFPPAQHPQDPAAGVQQVPHAEDR